MTYETAEKLLSCFSEPQKIGLFNTIMPEILTEVLPLESIKGVLLKQIQETMTNQINTPENENALEEKF